MFHALKTSRIAWLGIGLLAGLILGGIWPSTPLHAVTTDRTTTFAMATGPVDDEFEAVYFLDYLTGNLNAVVLGRQQGRGFTAFYQHNVLNDLGVNPGKKASYLMATGMANVRSAAARVRPSLAAVYVAEVSSGKVAAYAIPWSKNAHAAGQPTRGPLLPLGVTPFRAVAADAGAGAAPLR